MAEASGGRTFRALADLTDQNAETVRRYMQGQSPSVEFVTALCVALGINFDWLLTGAGPMKRSDARSAALKEANPTELLTAVAGALETVSGRLERLEIFVQTLEARVRAELSALGPNGKASQTDAAGGESDVEQAHADGPDQRARIVARSITGRSRSDAR